MAAHKLSVGLGQVPRRAALAAYRNVGGCAWLTIPFHYWRGERHMNLAVLVNIDVDDLPRAIDFYCRAFDLKTGRHFGSSGIELVGASSMIYLLEKAAGTSASPTTKQLRDYARHWTPVHLDFVVPDIDSAVARARSAGAVLESGIDSRNWGRIALMADPFGNGFCLVEFVGRGYDEIAS